MATPESTPPPELTLEYMHTLWRECKKELLGLRKEQRLQAKQLESHTASSLDKLAQTSQQFVDYQQDIDEKQNAHVAQMKAAQEQRDLDQDTRLAALHKDTSYEVQMMKVRVNVLEEHVRTLQADNLQLQNALSSFFQNAHTHGARADTYAAQPHDTYAAPPRTSSPSSAARHNQKAAELMSRVLPTWQDKRKGMPIQQFCDQVDQYYESSNLDVNNALLGMTVRARLIGAAATAVNKETRWPDIKRVLIQHFHRVNAETEATKELHQIRAQSFESFDDFVREFSQLVSDAKESDKTVNRCFLESLQDMFPNACSAAEMWLYEKPNMDYGMLVAKIQPSAVYWSEGLAYAQQRYADRKTLVPPRVSAASASPLSPSLSSSYAPTLPSSGSTVAASSAGVSVAGPSSSSTMDIDTLCRLINEANTNRNRSRDRDKDINCLYCGIRGHRVADCRKLKADKGNNTVRQGFDTQTLRYRTGFGPRGPVDTASNSSR